jgi:hypothetical protein
LNTERPCRGQGLSLKIIDPHLRLIERNVRGVDEFLPTGFAGVLESLSSFALMWTIALPAGVGDLDQELTVLAPPCARGCGFILHARPTCCLCALARTALSPALARPNSISVFPIRSLWRLWVSALISDKVTWL